MEKDKLNESDSWWMENYRRNEITALVLFGCAVMLLIALISFVPTNHSSWVPLNETSQAFSGENFVGPTGALLAGYVFFFCGAACYVIPAVLIWWAVQILVTKRSLRIRNVIALGFFVISTACIVDCQTFFFRDWIEKYHLPGSAGGIVGSTIGRQFFVRLFGPAGTFILMAIASILTLIVITGIHPFHFSRMIGRKIASFFRNIDWEEKWRLWSGVESPRESVYSVTRALPTPQTITVEPIITDEISPDPVLFAEEELPLDVVVEEEEDAEVDEMEDPPATAEETIIPEAPSPDRVRKIVDASQRHHNPAAATAMSVSRSPRIRNTFAAEPQFEDYKLPTYDILSYAKELNTAVASDEDLIKIQNQIIETLDSFKVEVEPGNITKGPTITRYEVYPSPGLRVNKITALKDDIARATRAEKINILAPIPGRDTVGIEIANSNKVIVALRELLESETFRNSKAKLPLVLGKDVYGKTIVGDLSRMPHLLVAGATGSGKSVCINSIIASLLYRFTPDELKFIMIDPKVVEMQLYNSLPHMVVPVVTDPKKVLLALRWVIREMENRYAMFAKKGARNFEGFNRLRAKEIRGQEIFKSKALQPNLINTETGEDFLMSDDLGDSKDPDYKSSGNDDDEALPERLPYIVVIIDELADLMQTAPADVETSIARIAQKARAAGIHLIIATQTPRADVITGTIKANIPSRIAFQVSSKTDSRIILDANGAENLVGKGDMLYLPPGSAQVVRAQGALITDEEAQSLVDVCASQGTPSFRNGRSRRARVRVYRRRRRTKGIRRG